MLGSPAIKDYIMSINRSSFKVVCYISAHTKRDSEQPVIQAFSWFYRLIENVIACSRWLADLPASSFSVHGSLSLCAIFVAIITSCVVLVRG